jgi:predicted esterase
MPGQCASNLVCVAGTCQFEGTVAAGGACWAHRDCAPQLYCAVSGRCEAAGTAAEGALCATGADCDKALVCDRFGVGGVCAAPGNADLGESCADTMDCVAGLACAESGICTPAAAVYPGFEGVSCAADLATFGVLFEVPRPERPLADFYRLPFPNDIRVRDEGTLDLDGFPRPGVTPTGRPGVDIVELLAAALSQDFAGFGSEVSVRLRFSRGFDGDFGPSAGYFGFVDITEGALEYGREVPRSLGYSVARGKYACQHSVVVRNQSEAPLLPGHTYAVYVTADVRSADGQAPQATPDFAAVLAPDRPAGDEALGRAWDVYAPLRAYLATQGMDAGTLAGAAVFTVGDPGARARALVEQALTTPLPIASELTLCEEGAVSPCGAEAACGPVDPAFHEIHGRLRVPGFQQGTAPYELEGGEIVEQSGVFQQNGNVEVCFALTVPRVPAGQEPAAWPLVVYGHGTGGRFNEIVHNGVARSLATASTPAAVLSLDAVVHGERRGASRHPAWTLLLNVDNPRAARDLRLQAAVDAVQALRMAQAGPLEVPGLAAPVALDPGKTVYMGHSQGADAGLMAGALSDGAAALVLSGAGGYLTDRVLRQTSPFAVADGFSLLLDDAVDHNHPYMTLWQTYVDSVDPVNYARLMYARPIAGVAAKHVLAIWGQGDTYVANSSSNALVQVMRLPVAVPVVEDLSTGTVARPVSDNKATAQGARTAACFQYEPDGPDGYDGNAVALLHEGAVSDWVAFVTSFFASGTPVVP